MTVAARFRRSARLDLHCPAKTCAAVSCHRLSLLTISRCRGYIAKSRENGASSGQYQLLAFVMTGAANRKFAWNEQNTMPGKAA